MQERHLDGVEERGLVNHRLDGTHATVGLLDGTGAEDLVAVGGLHVLQEGPASVRGLAVCAFVDEGTGRNILRMHDG